MGEDGPITSMTQAEVASYLEKSQDMPTFIANSLLRNQAIVAEANGSITLMQEHRSDEDFELTRGLEFCDLMRRTGFLKQWKPVDLSPADAQKGDRLRIRNRSQSDAEPFTTATIRQTHAGMAWKDDRLVARRPEARGSVVAMSHILKPSDTPGLNDALAAVMRRARSRTPAEREAEIQRLVELEKQLHKD